MTLTLSKCQTCKWFNDLAPGKPGEPGLCHRNPPSMMLLPIRGKSEFKTVWPHVGREDGCGEHKPAFMGLN